MGFDPRIGHVADCRIRRLRFIDPFRDTPDAGDDRGRRRTRRRRSPIPPRPRGNVAKRAEAYLDSTGLADPGPFSFGAEG